MTDQLDHIVIAHPDLTAAMQEFADLTGCLPKYGGPHPGGGTHNALVSLGDSVYLELISPDPEQMDTASGSQRTNLGQRLATYTGSKLLAWALRSNNLDAMAGEHHGFKTAAPFDMSRQQPNGDTLNWRLLNLVNHNLKGFAPFFIDWLTCPHPATNNPIAGEFVALKISHPDPNLQALTNEIVDVQFSEGSPSFTLEFNSKRGTINLGSSSLDGFWL